MTQEQRETMQRAVGIIEGICFVVNKDASDALACAVDMLDALLGKDATK